MAQIRAVFLPWRAAAGAAMEASTMEEALGVSGRPLLMVQTHGFGNCPVETQEFTGAVSTIYESGVLFVAFGMNRGGL